MLRRFLLVALCAVAAPIHAASAQTLRDKIHSLFTFGNCGQPLCLDGSINAANGHGDHFLPAVASGNGAVIDFLTQAAGQTVGNIPISATSSGATFAFVGGIPVQTSTSTGPIFGERAQTLGKGQFFMGANVTGIDFTSLNGTPLNDVTINFTHEDENPPGLGQPVFENDIIAMNLALDVKLTVASVFATVGLTDFMDLGVEVPFVRTSIHGVSSAQIQPFGTPAEHFFAGSSADPVLRAAAEVNGTAAGVGDVAGRLKINLGQSRTVGAAILTEVRLPTGNADNLLGSGSTSASGYGIVSMQFGNFAPHFNVGYQIHSDTLQNDAILGTVGFDDLMTPWATVAFDLISSWQVGASKRLLPDTVNYVFPYQRVVHVTDVQNRRLDVLNASLGVKFTVRGGMVLVVNGIAPLRKAGLQPDFIWTMGLERSF